MPHGSTPQSAVPSSSNTSYGAKQSHHAHHGKSHKQALKNHHSKALHKAGKWFKSQSPVIQVASVMGIGAIIGLVSILLFQLVALILVSLGLFTLKRRVTVKDAEMGGKTGSSWDHDQKQEEAHHLNDESLFGLPGYQQNGYISVEKNDF